MAVWSRLCGRNRPSETSQNRESGRKRRWSKPLTATALRTDRFPVARDQTAPSDLHLGIACERR
jgi:hypothetical protein